MGCTLFPVELQGAPWLDIKVSWCCLMLQVSVDLYKYLIKIFPKLSPTLIKCFEFPELNIYHVLAVRSRSWSEVMSSSWIQKLLSTTRFHTVVVFSPLLLISLLRPGGWPKHTHTSVSSSVYFTPCADLYPSPHHLTQASYDAFCLESTSGGGIPCPYIVLF